MLPIREFTALHPSSHLPAYLKAYKLLMEHIQAGQIVAARTFKIALLTSFTSRGLQEVLSIECAKLDILAEIFVGEYSQYIQALLSPTSALYAFSPDMLILFIDARSLLGELFFLPYSQTVEDRRKWVQTQVQAIWQLVETFQSHSTATVLLHNLEIPSYSPLGIQENKQSFGYIEAIEDLNRQLREACKGNTQCYLFDYNAFCSEQGKKQLYQPKMYYLGDMKLATEHYPALSEAYLAYIQACLLQTKKWIVLDLDGVLWGGIVGEDHLEGIQLGPTPEGRPYWEFQKLLQALQGRGILLAINSKNNEDDALQILKNHPHMVLKENHFAAVRINWQDKAANLQSLAEELNISLDTCVFIDDDPLNRARIKSSFPQVEVLALPTDPADFVSYFCKQNLFNTLQLTKEDLQRGKLYSERRQASQAQQQANNLDEFLDQLQMNICIEPVTPFSLPRLAQLTQKTNQLNMTTRRYMEHDLLQLASGQHAVLSVSVKDKFTDHGIVGVMIIKKSPTRWIIDTFLLSCRVIGRRIEHTMLTYVADQAKAAHVQELVGEFIPSPKNKVAAEIYPKFGFIHQTTPPPLQLWILQVNTWKS